MEKSKQNSALLIMDMQTAIIRNLPDATEFKCNVAKAIVSARTKDIPVLYIVVGFRQGMPEISMNNKSFSGSKERLASASMDDWMKIDSDVAPLPNDIVITKRRVSAFTGSDLEVVLRAIGVQHMILTGVATGGVVLSTLREAADKDYRITILSDCCADADPEVHRVLTTKVFPRQAEVVTFEEWSKML